jgi:hypothetical protein
MAVWPLKKTRSRVETTFAVRDRSAATFSLAVNHALTLTKINCLRRHLPESRNRLAHTYVCCLPGLSAPINRIYGLELEIVHRNIDPTFSSMAIDHQLAFANDTDADQHGIVIQWQDC